MSEPERDPASFSGSVRIGRRKYGFSLRNGPARALAAVMALCTLIVAAEVLALVVWLIVAEV